MLAIKQEDWPFLGFLRRTLRADAVQVVPLAGDASSRRYYRVIQGNQSWVLMQWEPFVDDANYPFLSVLEHFHASGVHVPEVVAKSPAEGLVLLEDLGDLTLERKFWENQNQELVIPFYKLAIDEIAKIHYDATANKAPCTAFKIAFDKEKFLWEMNYGKSHLLEKFCGLSLSVAELNTLDDVFSDICERLDREPKYISHRDYHSRNLMLKLDKICVIDFQDARLGPIQYDLVSLLKDSYVDINENVSEVLLSYYFERRRSHGLPAVSTDQFREIYEIQSIQRCFKACGSFASFYNLRQDKRYLKYLKHTLQKVKRSCGLFKEYRGFADILERHGVFDNNFDVT
ncbi:MAG TPA: phosphotransferase [Bdellovibrionales bacterium]|nr:phosphotransferase [Bdellovibrionales bacterium]